MTLILDNWHILSMVLYVLFLHWVADFVCQSRYMAANKAKCNYTLLWHVGVYSGVMAVGLSIFAYITKEYWSVFFFVAINAVLHYITDYFSSRQTTKAWRSNKIHRFFAIIGGDQFIHQLCLIGTLGFLI